MPKRIDKFSHDRNEFHRDRHRFEHWYVDNQVYFITARCRDRFPAFASEQAKSAFWDRFDHYTCEAGFVPWIVSLMDNHYHAMGYCPSGKSLKPMMQRLHGSAAKLANDVLLQAGLARLVPFWRDSAGRDYFDGCIRDEKQCRLAYRYTLTQARRHGIVMDWREYPHTHVNVELERAVKRALELGAFLEDVPYARYEGGARPGKHRPR